MKKAIPPGSKIKLFETRDKGVILKAVRKKGMEKASWMT